MSCKLIFLVINSIHSVLTKDWKHFRRYFTACTGSGLDIVSTNGTFTSPNYPNNYGNNANCEWRIRVPTGFVVLLKFDSFKLESGQNCRYDAVELRNTPISLIGSYCGAKGPFSIMSSGETLFVKFRSDSSQTRKGFSASFTAIIPPTNPPPGKNLNVN